MEKSARDRDSRVREVRGPSRGIPSNAVQVKLCMNPSRPLDKAKYSLATDSEPVPRGKGEKNPGEGSSKNLKSCVYKQGKHYARKGTCDSVPFAS